MADIKDVEFVTSKGIGDGAQRNGTYFPAMEDKIHHHGDLTEIYSTLLTGPPLIFMGRQPDGSYRTLEAWVKNRRGVLPTSLVSEENSDLRTQIDDPWLREIFCQIKMVGYKPDQGKPIYLAKFFIRIGKVHGDEEELVSREDGHSLEGDDGNIGVSLGDVPCTINRERVKGHARGLVSRAVQDRLDGVEFLYKTETEVHADSVRRPEVNIRIQEKLMEENVDERIIVPPVILTYIQADCVDALLKTVLRKAWRYDQHILESFACSRRNEIYSVWNNMKINPLVAQHGVHHWVLPSVSLSSVTRDLSGTGKSVRFTPSTRVNIKQESENQSLTSVGGDISQEHDLPLGGDTCISQAQGLEKLLTAEPPILEEDNETHTGNHGNILTTDGSSHNDVKTNTEGQAELHKDVSREDNKEVHAVKISESNTEQSSKKSLKRRLKSAVRSLFCCVPLRNTANYAQ